MESASPPADVARDFDKPKHFTQGASGKIRTGGTFQIYLIRTDHSQTLRYDVPFKVADLYGETRDEVRAMVHEHLDKLLDAAGMG